MTIAKGILANAVLALGFIGAMAIGGATPVKAQGFSFDAPGVHVHVGEHRHDWDRRYYDYAPGYYDYRDCPRGFTVQDGVCKPYRGY